MKREILKQKVYHDGTSMVVLKPKDKHVVPEALVQTWIDEGIIAGKTSKEIAAEQATSSDSLTGEDESGFGDYVVTPIPGGRFKVEGPGIDGHETVRGREAVDALIDNLTGDVGVGAPIE